MNLVDRDHDLLESDPRSDWTPTGLPVGTEPISCFFRYIISHSSIFDSTGQAMKVSKAQLGGGDCVHGDTTYF